MAYRHNITFNTEAEYNTFKASSEYSEPNVSYIKESNGVHYNPIDPYAGHTYVEIGGLKWATMNVGATAVTDTGLYFAWGDISGYTASQVGSGEGQKYFSENDYIYYNDGSYTKYNGVDSKITLESTDDAVKAAWGGNWRTPTVSEWRTFGTAVNTAWTADYQGSGVAGLVCTDKTDNTKVLFFPAAGSASFGDVSNVGDVCFYWSSSLYQMKNYYSSSYCMRGSESYVSWDNNMNYGNARSYGLSMRGVAD